MLPFPTVAALTAGAPQQPPLTLKWSGYTWKVRGAGVGGPGPNEWDAAGVWVDAKGLLHLKIRNVGGKWRCAELYTAKALGMGTYEFQVVGAIDKFDPNIVLGLFDYPTPGIGPDGTNEIDIEFARWGNPAWPNGNWTVYPASVGPKSTSHTFEFSLHGTGTTHRFTRTATSVAYTALEDDKPFQSWTFAPPDPARQVPQAALPVHLNLWLFQGKAPVDGKEVEIVVTKFSYKPQ